MSDTFIREELAGTGAYYAGDKGLATGTNPPKILQK
jgi:enolase